MSTDLSPDDDLLLAIDSAIYSYGVVGSRGSADQARLAREALTQLRLSRDLVIAGILEKNATPPPTPPAFATPEVNTPAEAALLAQRIELALVPRWSRVASISTGENRSFCIIKAQESATRAISWGAASAAFPGVEDGSSASPSSSPTAG